MSSNSPMADDSESDFEFDSMEYFSQNLHLNKEGTPGSRPKWVEYVSDEDDVDYRPKIPILQRIRMEEEREKELMRIADAREMATIPDDYVPEPPPKQESEEEQVERYKAWCEKLERIQREKEEIIEKNRKVARAHYEKYAKLQKEYCSRDYYWKPDPLYALHMKELGYSKIAIDKALFYTDNKSVAKAVEYLKKNPNPTELTKEEVMAVGEEVLKRIRPVKPYKHDYTEQTLSKEGEMEIEQASQPFLADDDYSKAITVAIGNPEGGNEGSKEVPKGNPVSDSKDNDGKMEDGIRRGIKRNYAGEEVESFPTTSTAVEVPLPVKKENDPEYKMMLIVNTQLLMDCITLSLEVGKVVANIANELNTGTDELKKIFEEWIKEGNKMSMYKGKNNDHLRLTYECSARNGLITYLGKCSHYRDVKTPSPTVLGIFGEIKQFKGLHNCLELM